MKQIISHTLRIAGFLFLAAVLAFLFNQLLNTKVRSYIQTDEAEAAGSQVMFFGTSQGQTDINPYLLWENEGIESYNFCQGGQYIGATYYVMKDVLNRHQPDFVILDYESLVRPDSFLTIGNKMINFPMVSDVKLRWELYQELIGDAPVYFIPFFRYHNRWKELGIGDRIQVQTMLGSISGEASWDETELPNLEASKERIPVGERELYYFNKIRELVQEVPDCELVLVDLPGISTEQETKINNWVRDLAKAENIRLLEANSEEARSAMGLTAKDFIDEYHLNFTGQKKLTSYLGKWMTAQEIPGKNAGETSSWAADTKKARSIYYDYEIILADSQEKLLKNVAQGDQTAVLVLSSNPEEQSDALFEAVSHLGITGDQYAAGGVFLRQENGDWERVNPDLGGFHKTISAGAYDVTVRGSRMQGADGRLQTDTQICIGRESSFQTESGNHLWVYSRYRDVFLRCEELGAGDKEEISVELGK